VDLGLDGRVAIVTGGSRGIGRAVACRLARERARVAVTYRHDARAAGAVVTELAGLGCDATSVHLDLGALDSISGAVESVLATWGRVDVLVNNAVETVRVDRVPPQRFDRLEPAEWQRLITSNVHGAFAAVQAVLPSMLSRGWGRVVNVSSTAAEDGMSGYGWYAVAKASLHGLTRTVAAEVGRAGILVNTVMPGPTATPRIAEGLSSLTRRTFAASSSLGRMLDPNDIAAAVAFLGSGANTAITGEIVRVGGRLRPPSFRDRSTP
jgi:3-oxoacyl-[acyl-carrier protein] reductase